MYGGIKIVLIKIIAQTGKPKKDEFNGMFNPNAIGATTIIATNVRFGYEHSKSEEFILKKVEGL